jgi:phosphoribosylaminoimidazole carboxylase
MATPTPTPTPACSSSSSSSSNSKSSCGHMTGKPIRVACLGGGQLGRMMALEAPRINVSMSFLDPKGPSCPAGQVVAASNMRTGSLHNPDDIRALVVGAAACDVLTVEIEHVDVETLEVLEQEGVNVQPSARVLKIIRDKFSQKVGGG